MIRDSPRGNQNLVPKSLQSAKMYRTQEGEGWQTNERCRLRLWPTNEREEGLCASLPLSTL